MAEKEEGKAKNTVEKTSHQPNKNQQGWENLQKIIQTFLPAIGLFGALSYFLGRLHVESYYYALGITPNVLTFTTNDYMFSSFNMVIMCLVFSVLFYLCWEWFISAEMTEKTPFEVAAQRRVKIIIIVISIWVISILYIILFHEYTWLYVTGFSGLFTGLMYGITVIVLAVAIRPNSEKPSKKPFILLVLILVILIFSFMPAITKDLAEAQAQDDVTKFPAAKIIYKDTFPDQLQDLSSNVTDCVEGQVIITNNGMTYVLQSDNTTCEKWKVYALPVDRIKDIIYLHGN
jgi:hypothetical protein